MGNKGSWPGRDPGGDGSWRMENGAARGPNTQARFPSDFDSTKQTNRTKPTQNNMATGNGKIAGLPFKIREELNHRLNDGGPGNELVAWLNSIPEVKWVLTERFDGCPISEQNLSEWRKRGYQRWLYLHLILDETDALSKNAEQIAGSGINCDKLLPMLTASYPVMIQRWNITPMDEMNYKMNVFRDLTNAVLALQRAELQKARLEIARERLELFREKQRDKSASSSCLPSSTSAEGAASQPRERPASSESPGAAVPSRSTRNGNPSPEQSRPADTGAASSSGALSPCASPSHLKSDSLPQSPALAPQPPEQPFRPSIESGIDPDARSVRNSLGMV